jgi:peptide/nickel transport system permease protein
LTRLKYLIRRLFLTFFVLFGVSLLTFYLTRGIPGINPVVLYVSPDTPPSQYKLVAAQYGLDRPLHEQYVHYMSALLRGDLGYSRTSGAPTLRVILKLLPATLELALVGFIFAVTIGIPLGIVSAIRRDSYLDSTVKGISLLAVSTPSFWFGLLLQFFFFYWLRQKGFPYLPSTGRIHPVVSGDLGSITGLYLIDSLLTLNLSHLLLSLKYLVMPALALALFPLGLLVRVVRSSVLEVLSEDYIVFARSKGITEKALVWRHVLKNALIPVVTITGLIAGRMMGGAVIVETVFAWPGLGSWASRAILENDLSGIMGFTLTVAVSFVLINFLVDLLYSFLDPRIRY